MLDLAARSIVHSLLLVIIGGVIAFYPGSPTSSALLNDAGGPASQKIETKVLSAKSDCPGVKLNYPRVFAEIVNGQEVTFRYNCILQNFRATSYDGHCPGCSGRTHFTGESVTWGVCAVDPTVLAPLSTFYIPGYGLCRAADTGGAIKGKRIDLGFEDTATSWWNAKNTDVLILTK